MTKYQKYTWICTSDCDALIEYTFKDGYGWPNGVMDLTCRCGTSCTLLSVEDATIPYTDSSLPTKEEQMEETSMNNLPLSDAEKYNPDLLVTYKVIRGYSDAEYATDKVRNIEYELHNGRTNSKTASVLQNKIDSVQSIISDSYADSEDQEVLRSIAEALDIQLTREVEWSATIEVSGTLTIDLLEDSDMDIEQEIYDNLYVESQNGQIEVVDTEVTNVREN
jgi:neutral trehalase